VLGFALLCAGIDMTAAQDGETFVMRLATPTLNDAQHEWMKRRGDRTKIRRPR